MNVIYSKSSPIPRFVVDESDIPELNAIMNMMKSRAWNDLQKYWAIGRETILKHLKESNRTLAGSKLASSKISIYDGYDLCLSVPESVINQAQQFIEAQKEAKKNADAEPTYGEDE